MHRKNFIISLFAIALFLAASAVSFAQTTAPIRGKVQLKKADNTIVPVADAEITAYRTDITKGKLPSAKTDKKGYFSFAGVPYAQTFVLVATAPNIRAGYYPNVKANMDNIVIEVEEGDGKVPSEEEIRAALSTVSETGELTAEEKKKQEEFAKKNAEIAEKNKRTQQADSIAQKAFAEGKAAFELKDYNLAIAKADEGITAVPDYVGSTPVLLYIKGLALKDRGFLAYKEGAAITDVAARKPKYEVALKDWMDALAAFSNGLNIIKNAPATTDANDLKSRNGNRYLLLFNSAEVHRLMAVSGVDRSKGKEAITLYEEYMTAEADPVKKSAAQLTLAEILREDGESDLAITAYRKVLETSPDNPDALAGLGLSLFNAGFLNNSQEQKQEGLNILERFTQVAPDTHRLKASVKDAVDYLKNQEKLTPVKSTKPTTPKKKT